MNAALSGARAIPGQESFYKLIALLEFVGYANVTKMRKMTREEETTDEEEGKIPPTTPTTPAT